MGSATRSIAWQSMNDNLSLLILLTKVNLCLNLPPRQNQLLPFCCCALELKIWKSSWWCDTTRSISASGALVFPGGKADPQDFDDALIPYLRGAEADTDMRAAQVSAIREAFEECGILLAREAGSDDIIQRREISGTADLPESR